MKTMQEAKVINLIPPVAIVDDNASWTTTEIDTLGFKKCSIYVNLGASDIAMAALKVQESDTTGSGFADIDGLDFSSDGTLPSATDDGLVFAVHIDLTKNRKRFLDLVATAGNGSTGTFASGLAFLYDAVQTPSSASECGVSQQLFA